MKINRWIVSLVLALVVCGSVRVRAEDPKCPNGSHYYIYNTSEITHYDGGYHYAPGKCQYCGYTKELYLDHNFGEEYTIVLDSTYHAYCRKCKYCNYIYMEKREHYSYGTTHCVRKATPAVPGESHKTCQLCPYVLEVIPFGWSHYGLDSIQYDIEGHSTVYQNSKKITVYLENGLKGATLQVKIGKKIYKKKLKNNKKKVTIKIKPSPYGKSVKTKLLYKGRVIGTEIISQFDFEDENVMYSRNLRKGMTKKQALYTWGPADDEDDDSNGRSYWYYDDGSYIVFQGGRVSYWRT